MARPALLWFRLDLRLADNPALSAAIKHGGAVIPVFIWAAQEEAPWLPGAASRWWLHQALAALEATLRQAGSRLILRRGPSLETIQSLVQETGADAVFWNRRYEPNVQRRDKAVEGTLQGQGVEFASFNAALLHEPWTIQNKSGNPFQVFTPFWRHCLVQANPPPPLPAPAGIPAPQRWPQSLQLAELELEPRLNWAAGFARAWKPGEAGARALLNRFVQEAHLQYAENRDRPDLPGSSRLSPHLHFGEISPRQVWHTIRQTNAPRMPSEDQFLTEIGWREFAHHLLHHFPHTPQEPLREQFAKFPWHSHEAWLKAWQKGQTGVPLVDAGLRELWITGWMHNRVRMVVASFLVKNLLIPWTDGARWFWDTLVDADLASNTLGWQWTAGCGADAAPFFRVFNPVNQGEKFDPTGAYVRHWVPELGLMPADWIHQPWKAPTQVLVQSKVKFGETYPLPIVNPVTSREAALAAYARIRSSASRE